ncbi:starch phosphorylase [Sulfuritortus calidifontis]|uniref:Starch phosphorylase n=1 Tax=Sulfuritortus calidifontis TaxID=1914471 RepID=A0A4R3JZM0_9PROT|nr:alpha-glucan family phosphorylase [Sulfuritortus calidifontis]TCS72651.1 starch phosphorylase [Sulfuritortus calidifontis]
MPNARFSIDDFIHQPRIAYFSMEIALVNDIPTYSGGLGVLAGDTLRAAADMALPMVAVTLVSRAGYFRQEIDAAGRQVEHPDAWEPSHHASRLDAAVALNLEGRQVWVGGWLYVARSRTGGGIPVLLLDTDLPVNHHQDRDITHYLYGGDEAYRIKQEMVLGVGGVAMLQALGFRVIGYHMNEGHSAFLTLALLRRYAYAPEELRPGESRYDVPRVRDLCVFTTHTPIEAGHDKFAYDRVQQIYGDLLDLATIKLLAGQDRLNMTQLALNLSEFVNGVAKRHAETSRKLFPGYAVHAITNGVHSSTWTNLHFGALYDANVPGWCHEPELLARADRIPDEQIWQAHIECKRDLIDTVQQRTGVALDPDQPILGFARRMTAYKRPEMLFADLERLKAIARKRPFQLVMAGKAHPKDAEGKRLIEALHGHMRELNGIIPMAFLPNYDMATALAMVSGADVWLNTPLRPLEASGTSGMKAAFNGVPQLSVLDGWWLEGCIEGVTGWAIGDDNTNANGGDAAMLYDKLEQVVLPLWYDNRAGWVAVMKGAISKNAAYFNSQRMMRRYATEAYLR